MTEAYSEKVSFDLREGEIAVELPEKFEHTSGAGAEIEQRADRLVGKRRADRFFDGGVGDV